MIKDNIINNISLDKLPDDVQEVMFEVFNELSVRSKLIVLSKITHGALFKTSKVDLFKLNTIPVNKEYDNYVKVVKARM